MGLGLERVALSQINSWEAKRAFSCRAFHFGEFSRLQAPYKRNNDYKTVMRDINREHYRDMNPPGAVSDIKQTPKNRQTLEDKVHFHESTKILELFKLIELLHGCMAT